MAATRPEQIIELFVASFNAGDLEGLTSLYESGAAIIPEPGQDPLSGVSAISEFFKGFLAMKGRLTVLASSAVQCGDIALTHSSWRLDAPGAEPMEGATAEVSRRQPDGTWLYVIDNPWGAGVLAAATAR